MRASLPGSQIHNDALSMYHHHQKASRNYFPYLPWQGQKTGTRRITMHTPTGFGRLPPPPSPLGAVLTQYSGNDFLSGRSTGATYVPDTSLLRVLVVLATRSCIISRMLAPSRSMWWKAHANNAMLGVTCAGRGGGGGGGGGAPTSAVACRTTRALKGQNPKPLKP